MKKPLLAVTTFLVIGMTSLVPLTVNADDGALSGVCASGSEITASSSAAQSICKNKDQSSTNIIQVIVNTLLTLIGTISVIMLIYGGIRYTTSAGNSSQVSAAKNTIIYALIGLIVAVLAAAIVNFVVMAVNNGSSTTKEAHTTKS